MPRFSGVAGSPGDGDTGGVPGRKPVWWKGELSVIGTTAATQMPVPILAGGIGNTSEFADPESKSFANCG